jgi:hypothetical protein
MPSPSKSPPAWGQVLAAAERLDAGRGTTRYSRAVITAMLARVVERLPAPPPPRLVFSRQLFAKPRPPVFSPLQQRMAERRRKAYDF